MAKRQNIAVVENHFDQNDAEVAYDSSRNIEVAHKEPVELDVVSTPTKPSYRHPEPFKGISVTNELDRNDRECYVEVYFNRSKKPMRFWNNTKYSHPIQISDCRVVVPEAFAGKTLQISFLPDGDFNTGQMTVNGAVAITDNNQPNNTPEIQSLQLVEGVNTIPANPDRKKLRLRNASGFTIYFGGEGLDPDNDIYIDAIQDDDVYETDNKGEIKFYSYSTELDEVFVYFTEEE